MSRQKILTVTIKDCEVQTFRAGGKGGQNQNKRDSGVRVIHPPSGARGESREGRSQIENKRKAFRRMAESREFQTWVRVISGGLEVRVERMLRAALENDESPGRDRT